MEFDKIVENKPYNYAYNTKEGTWTGYGKVIEKITKRIRNGNAVQKVILVDKVNDRTVTLWPSQVTGRR